MEKEHSEQVQVQEHLIFVKESSGDKKDTLRARKGAIQNDQVPLSPLKKIQGRPELTNIINAHLIQDLINNQPNNVPRSKRSIHEEKRRVPQPLQVQINLQQLINVFEASPSPLSDRNQKNNSSLRTKLPALSARQQVQSLQQMQQFECTHLNGKRQEQPSRTESTTPENKSAVHLRLNGQQSKLHAPKITEEDLRSPRNKQDSQLLKLPGQNNVTVGNILNPNFPSYRPSLHSNTNAFSSFGVQPISIQHQTSNLLDPGDVERVKKVMDVEQKLHQIQEKHRQLQQNFRNHYQTFTNEMQSPSRLTRSVQSQKEVQQLQDNSGSRGRSPKSIDYLGENEESNVIENTAEVSCPSSEESGDDGFEEPQTAEQESVKEPLNQSFMQEKETASPEGTPSKASVTDQHMANQIIQKTFIAETDSYLLRKFDCDPAIIGLQPQFMDEGSCRMKLNKEEIRLIRRVKKNNTGVKLDKQSQQLLLAISNFVVNNIHKINQAQQSQLGQQNPPLNKNFYSVYITGMKKFMHQIKRFQMVIKQIEAELERTDTKRVDLKRKEIKFTKQQTIGYKLDSKRDAFSHRSAQQQLEEELHQQLIEQANRKEFEQLIVLRYDNKLKINQEFLPILRELMDKYCPLHELTMDQQMEGIDYGFPNEVKEQKRAYKAEAAKRRAVEYRDRMVLRQKLTEETEKRRMEFERSKARLKELERQQRDQILMYSYRFSDYETMKREMKGEAYLQPQLYNNGLPAQKQKKLSKRNFTLESCGVSREIEYVQMTNNPQKSKRALERADGNQASSRKLPMIETPQTMSPNQRMSHVSDRNFGSPINQPNPDTYPNNSRYHRQRQNNSIKEIAQQHKNQSSLYARPREVQSYVQPPEFELVDQRVLQQLKNFQSGENLRENFELAIRMFRRCYGSDPPQNQQ